METEALAEREGTEELSSSEVRALREAAAWYAKYHQRIIAEAADDRSAAGAARRRHFSDLYAALEKLGLKLAAPAGPTDQG